MLHSDQKPVLKYGACALLMLAFFLVQSTRGLAIHVRGMSVNAMPFFVAAVALFEGPFAGGSFGFFAGTLLSVNAPGMEGFSTVFLTLFGVIFGLFGSHYLREVALSALSGGVLCTALESLLRYLFSDYLVYGMSLLQWVERLSVGLALSLPMGVLAYVLVRRIHRRFTEEAS